MKIYNSLIFITDFNIKNLPLNLPINNKHDSDTTESWQFKEMQDGILIMRLILFVRHSATFFKFIEYFLFHLLAIHFCKFL